jgi:nucleotide-binding universal stress UspA family protein
MPTLICYDGSESSKHALSVAQATLGHKPAILVHVWNPPDEYLADAFGTGGGSSGPSIVELERLARGRAQAIAHEGEEIARELGLQVETRVERNKTSVWRTILDLAAETDAELILVGTHGSTVVQTALLGSVSNALLHHSERPVLVVPIRAG